MEKIKEKLTSCSFKSKTLPNSSVIVNSNLFKVCFSQLSMSLPDLVSSKIISPCGAITGTFLMTVLSPKLPNVLKVPRFALLINMYLTD